MYILATLCKWEIATYSTLVVANYVCVFMCVFMCVCGVGGRVKASIMQSVRGGYYHNPLKRVVATVGGCRVVWRNNTHPSEARESLLK